MITDPLRPGDVVRITKYVSRSVNVGDIKTVTRFVSYNSDTRQTRVEIEGSHHTCDLGRNECEIIDRKKHIKSLDTRFKAYSKPHTNNMAKPPKKNLYWKLSWNNSGDDAIVHPDMLEDTITSIHKAAKDEGDLLYLTINIRPEYMSDEVFEKLDDLDL